MRNAKNWAKKREEKRTSLKQRVKKKKGKEKRFRKDNNKAHNGSVTNWHSIFILRQPVCPCLFSFFFSSADIVSSKLNWVSVNRRGLQYDSKRNFMADTACTKNWHAHARGWFAWLESECKKKKKEVKTLNTAASIQQRGKKKNSCLDYPA